MIKHVARKEVREIVRDGRMRLLGVIVIILTLAALAFGAQQAVGVPGDIRGVSQIALEDRGVVDGVDGHGAKARSFPVQESRR